MSTLHLSKPCKGLKAKAVSSTFRLFEKLDNAERYVEADRLFELQKKIINPFELSNRNKKRWAGRLVRTARKLQNRERS